jgi:hypothetical protein
MIDHSKMKLGRAEARHDRRTLQLSKYLPGTLPPPPIACKYSDKVDIFPMYKNDEIGDCTFASAAHMIQAWAAAGKSECVDIGDAAVVAAYSASTGYDPNNPDSDQGAVELDVLKYWKNTGIGGHKIGAYVSVEPRSTTLVRDAISLFGGLYIGLALPVAAQHQAVWEVPPGGARGDGKPGSWGGHAVPILDYDPRGLSVVTWGAVKRLSWGFLRLYCEEAYAILSEDFVTDGKAGSGFDVATLQADLALLGH